MATPANSVSTANIKGQREDLLDAIYMIDPFDTPFMSSIGKSTANAIKQQWQTDELRSPSVNAVIEGEDATINPGTFTTLLDNICQISDETLQVTGTTDAVRKAGRANELAYQLAKKSKELKLDMEYGLVGVAQAKVNRSSSVAGQLGNIFAYHTTNGSLGATGVAPVGDGSNTGTPGTARMLTEAMILTASQNIWNEGGKANKIMCNGSMKQAISKKFVGRATQVQLDSSASKISQSVDFYETDFGSYTIVPNRWFKADAVFIYDPAMYSLAYLRGFKQYPLAKTGDSEKRQLLVEYTLRVNNEKSGALIRDVTVPV